MRVACCGEHSSVFCDLTSALTLLHIAVSKKKERLSNASDCVAELMMARPIFKGEFVRLWDLHEEGTLKAQCRE